MENFENLKKDLIPNDNNTSKQEFDNSELKKEEPYQTKFDVIY